MEVADIALIKKRSLSGIVALTSRTFLLQVIAFASTFLLTIFLTPAVFGVFYVVSAIIAFLGYFSDIGLAAALIQKKDEVTHDDLITTFTIQQILVGVVVIISLLLSSRIGIFYNLDRTGVLLFQALIISFFLSSLKTIPSVLLERKLEFSKLIIPQIAETLGFYVVAVVLAWQGHGIASFTWAVLTRGVVGLVAMYIVSPWRISIGISGAVARQLLRFGLPFQLNSFIALMKDDLLTIFLGKILPFAEIGYIGWAKKWSEVPLRLVMDSVIRVTFPAFSRLQSTPHYLGRAIEKTLFGISLAVFPISVGLAFFMHPLVGIIPRYIKWEPALLSFYLFVCAATVASVSTPLTNAINAIGRITITLRLMIMWTVTTWISTLILVSLFGFNGFAMALVLVSLTNVIVVVIVKRVIPFRFFPSIRIALLGAFVQGVWYATFLPLGSGTAWFVTHGILGVILYAGVVWVFARKPITEIFHSFLPS